MFNIFKHPLIILILFGLQDTILGQNNNTYGKPSGGVHEAWVRNYIGPGSFYDMAVDIAIDDSGYVYVTGSSVGLLSSLDYATIKYNSHGDTLWVARYTSQGAYEDEPVAIAVDKLGNIYVTGSNFEPSTNGDFATVKYNSNGVEQWIARYNSHNNSGDIPPVDS